MKPDSQKSYLEQGGDMLKGKSDVSRLTTYSSQAELTSIDQSAASSAQPESQKSYTQQAGDTVSGNQNENSGSLMESAKVSSLRFRVDFRC